MASNSPAEIADVIDVTLEGAGVVAGPGGKRVLVPGALAGEQISFRLSSSPGVAASISPPFGCSPQDCPESSSISR